MKTKAQVKAMLERIEISTGLDGARHPLIMAFEWILNGPISTSLSLEDWLEENGEGKVA